MNHDGSSSKDRSTLLDFQIGEWPPLGGSVQMTLAGSKTVLVGRNGAGKSAILEGLWQVRQQVTDDPSYRHGLVLAPVPGSFACTLEDRMGARIAYSYRISAYSGGPRMQTSFEERCYRPDSGAEIWRVQQGTATFAKGTTLHIPTGAGVLSLWNQIPDEPAAQDLLGHIFWMNWIQAGVPRVRRGRVPIVVEISFMEVEGARSGVPIFHPYREEERIWALAHKLVAGRGSDAFQEFIELGRRMEAWQDVRVQIYEPRGDPGGSKKQLAMVTFDGTDIGLLADGTLRVAEILWALVNPMENRFLLIEEPETGIHPGLLAALLDAIDSSAAEQQVLVSTHSPQVVSWARPEELRLVSRKDGKTGVRGLNAGEVAQVLKYLNERTLGEYVYCGGLSSDE